MAQTDKDIWEFLKALPYTKKEADQLQEVKWIKIVTDIFDNRKIRLIRNMPKGDAIVVTWFQLLCLAGETNDNGLIYITKSIPYIDESLSDAFDTSLSTIRLALHTFEQLEMISTVNSYLCIINWEKYQNVDGLDKIREQTRTRVAKHRKKQLEASVTVTLPVTHGNATERDKEIDIDNTPIVPKGTRDSLFQRFWKAYPRKVGKGAAEKAFAKLSVEECLLDTILKAVESQKQSPQWQRDGGQYIPYPATWLNQHRWEDETEQVITENEYTPPYLPNYL